MIQWNNFKNLKRTVHPVAWNQILPDLTPRTTRLAATRMIVTETPRLKPAPSYDNERAVYHDVIIYDVIPICCVALHVAVHVSDAEPVGKQVDSGARGRTQSSVPLVSVTTRQASSSLGNSEYRVTCRECSVKLKTRRSF
eukprot:sb/3474330/